MAASALWAGSVGVSSTAEAAQRTPTPERIFSSSAPAYQRLPANAPVDPNSAKIVANLKDWGIREYGDKAKGVPSMNINAYEYSTPFWLSSNADPKYDIVFQPCGMGNWNDFSSLRGVHIPDSARPSPGTDGQMSVWNRDSQRLVELWQARKVGNTWTACHGGNIAHTGSSNGIYPWPAGVSASGTSLHAYTVKASELQKGQINHAVGIALPNMVIDTYISKPATRTDGNRPRTDNTISEGQILRLPAHVNVDAMNLHPVAKTMAKAAQQYGFVVVDRSGGISFSVENAVTYPSDPFRPLFGNADTWNVMWGGRSGQYAAFPFDQLQVIRRDYVTPGGSAVPQSPATVASTQPDRATTAPTTTRPATTAPAATTTRPATTAPAATTTRPVTTAPAATTTRPATTAPAAPRPFTSAPATALAVRIGDQGASTFGFDVAGAAPAGSQLVVTWKRDGRDHRTVTTNPRWWSGLQPGYTDATASIQDSTGRVLARSAVIKATVAANVPQPTQGVTTTPVQVTTAPRPAITTTTASRPTVSSAVTATRPVTTTTRPAVTTTAPTTTTTTRPATTTTTRPATTNPVAPTTTTRPATTTASRPTVTSVTTSAPRPTGTGAVPTTPGTNPTASGPIAVADHGRNTFGFRVTGQVPAGTRLVVSWEREGVNQRTVTTNMYWWSGNQSGYRNARAELVDASGKVFALSDRISTRP